MPMIAAEAVYGQDNIAVTAPNSVIENPFAVTEPVPPIVPEEPQAPAKVPARRGPTSYQNPFANTSKAPPMDTSLRPGPVSRWRRPTIPSAAVSPIRAAVVLQPEPIGLTASQARWDQLPPGEVLRQRAAAPSDATDPAFYDRIVTSNSSIRFNPTPLDQPPLVVAEAPQITALPPVVNSIPALFPAAPDAAPVPIADSDTQSGTSAAKANPLSSAFILGDITPSQPAPVPAVAEVAIATTTTNDDLPTLISDGPETAENWLAEAQEIATDADSAADLSAVIEACDRGMQLESPPKVRSSLQKLAAWAYNRRGELHADEQRPEEAIKDFQEAIKLDANCSLAIHNRAVTLAQRNQFAAALRDFNRVIELNPGLAIAYRNRAELLSALGRAEEAAADYSRAIEALPEDASLLLARGRAYQRTGDFARATADVNRAVELSPNDPDALTQRGNLAAEQGKFAAAQQDYLLSIKIDDSWSEAYRSLAWLEATCPQQQFRNAKLATAHAVQAFNLASPEDYMVLDTLAAAQASAGDFEQAAQLAQKAVELAPRDASTPLELRLAMYRRGEAYVAATAQSTVRMASHQESETSPQPRPSPKSRVMPK